MTSLTDPFPSIDDLRQRTAGGSDADLARSRAFDEGRRAGFETGRFEGSARGMSDARAECAEQIRELHRGIGRSSEIVQQQHHETGAQLIDLAIDIASAILRREVSLSADRGRDALVRALVASPDRGDIVARLSPGDAELLGDHGDVSPGRTIQIVVDPLMSDGDCVLDVGGTRIDARLAGALDRVRAVLLGDAPDTQEGFA